MTNKKMFPGLNTGPMMQSCGVISGTVIAVIIILTSCVLYATDVSATTSDAIISGTVRSTSGSPLYGILVRAKGEGRNHWTAVFTNDDGQYDFPPLPPGRYQLMVGKQWQETVELDKAGTSQDFEITLDAGLVNQTTGVGWAGLMPGSDAEKQMMQRNCGSCHSYWRLFDRPARDAQGWDALSRRMVIVYPDGNPPERGPGTPPYLVFISESDFKQLTEYLERSITPEFIHKHLTDTLVRPRGEAARAVFTEWDLSGQVRETGIAWTEPETGIVWVIVVTQDGHDGVGRLDMHNNEFTVYPSEFKSSVFHDIVGDQDGKLWITVSRANRVVKFDPSTLRYQSWDISVPGARTGGAHTGDWDPDGNYWITMTMGDGAVVKLDPETGEVTAYHPATKKGEPYGLQVDVNGDVWFTLLSGNKLVKIDRQSGELVEYAPPTANSGTRRIQVDSKGTLWFSQFFADKIGALDPQTMQWQEYDIGIPGGSPYWVKIDRNDQVWFNLMNGNSLGRLDPQTGKMVLYQLPRPDSLSRDAFFDYSRKQQAVVYGHSSNGPGGNVGVGRMYIRP